MDWQPILTAPKDGSVILAAWNGGADYAFVIWKTNRRIVEGHKHGEDAARELAESYFGDPDESDDYDFAKAGNSPSHWLPLRPPHTPASITA